MLPEPNAGALTLVYADDTLLVMTKPAGLLCVPGRGPDKQDCLSARVQSTYPDALVVHRLDQATSGLVLMARGMPAQRALGQAFAQRQVEKHYVAVVAGLLHTPADAWTRIDLPIAPDWPNRPRRIIAPHGQASATLVRALEHDHSDQTTRVALQPLSGRTHQLRVHLQAIGHPIVGDALYAPPPIAALAPRLLLHAQSLSFAHPHSGALMQFHCPPEF